MFQRIKDIEKRYEELERLLSDATVIANRAEYQKLAKEHADLTALIQAFREYEKTGSQLDEAQADAARWRRGAQGTGRGGNTPAQGRDSRSSKSASPSCCCRRTPTTTRTSSWRSGPARAGTRPGFLPPICSACTRVTPRCRAGAWRLSVPARHRAWAGSRKSSP